jgi:hypothetical protein
MQYDKETNDILEEQKASYTYVILVIANTSAINHFIFSFTEPFEALNPGSVNPSLYEFQLCRFQRFSVAFQIINFENQNHVFA